jgi:hypothetical protein
MLKSMMVDGGRSLIWQMQIQVDQSWVKRHYKRILKP